MRPAIEVAADVVSHNQPGSVLQGIAVIEADRAELVAEIVAELPKLMLKAEVTVELTKAIQAKFGSNTS